MYWGPNAEVRAECKPPFTGGAGRFEGLKVGVEAAAWQWEFEGAGEWVEAFGRLGVRAIAPGTGVAFAECLGRGNGSDPELAMEREMDLTPNLSGGREQAGQRAAGTKNERFLVINPGTIPRILRFFLTFP